MRTLSITKVIEIRFEIKGVEGYGFGNDKQLYNLKTSNRIKQTINGRSIGYWIGKKFYSKNKLKPLLVRPKHFDCPF